MLKVQLTANYAIIPIYGNQLLSPFN